MAKDIRVIFTGNAADLVAAAAESDVALESVGKSADKSGGKLKQFGAVMKYAVPILGGTAIAALGLTGNLGSLAGVLPVLTTGLGLVLAPLAAVAAIMVALIAPILTVTGLLGVLGLGFALAAKQAFGKGGALAPALAKLETQFDNLTRVLVGRFMPVFKFLATSASSALGYLTKIAKLPLAQAFSSLATTGVAGLTRFLEHIGTIIGKPIRLAFQLAFGKPGQGVRDALGKIWDQILGFFRNPPKGGGVSIDAMMSAWFGRQDFTKTGLRWGMELAGAIVQGVSQTLQHTLGSRGIGFMLGGAAAGFAAGGPIGAALGAGIGLALNHYWPQITAAAKRVWGEVKTYAVAKFHEMTTALEHFLGPTTWHNLGTIAKNTWDTIKTVAIGAFHAIVSAAKLLWQIFDTLIIKTGAWKVAVALVKGAIFLVAAVLAPITGVIKTIIGWVIRFANHVNDLVLPAFQAVASIVAGIVSGIEDAVGLATKLASALGNFNGGNVHRKGHGAGRTVNSATGGAGVTIHVHGNVLDGRDLARLVTTGLQQHARQGGLIPQRAAWQGQ